MSSRFADFWLLGGASILLFLLMFIANLFRGDSSLIQQKFLLFSSFFALASAVCNHPHFMITYRFGYGRGGAFVLKYWFSLLVVPLALLAIYIIAYVYFERDFASWGIVSAFNQFFAGQGWQFRVGEGHFLGPALMGLTIWGMYGAVGWHYSKQVYGCMMVYNHYDGYGLSSRQKLWIRYSLIALATYQFLYLSELMDQAVLQGLQGAQFMGFKISPIGLPHLFLSVSGSLMLVGALGTLSIFVAQYYQNKKLPSALFLVPWVAIYVWWIQLAEIPEFYFLAVPFFHSLQYLPFAAKMENKKIPHNRFYNTQVTVRILVLLAIGLLFFEIIPNFLDAKFDTVNTKSPWFFVTAFAVFINIHHFFIDSTVWRLEQSEVKSGILNSPSDLKGNEY